jgi:hypothetical protein
MRRLEVVGALLVFLGIALALYLERPEPPDASLFGAALALEPVLGPLETPLGTHSLSGRVTTVAGAPAADAFLVLVRSADDASGSEPLHVKSLFHAYTDAEGCFALARLTSGRYRGVLTHPSAPPRILELELPLAGEVEWQLAAPLPPLPVLPELRRTELVGRVRRPPGLSGAGNLEGFEVVLTPADNPLLSGACERRASTDAEGRFALQQLVVASYRCQVLPTWALGGTWPVLAQGACTAREGWPNEIELTLDVGALEGELREAVGRPLVGALVVVSALDARDAMDAPQLCPPIVTDQAGRYRVELLPPGRYRLHLRAGSAAQDMEVMVEAGRLTSVPPGVLDPRASDARAGG